MKKLALTAFFALITATAYTYFDSTPYDYYPDNPEISYRDFQDTTEDVREFRARRRVGTRQFMEMAKGKDTIILDTRSAANFKSWHIKGSINLNFSEFTQGKLATVIPNKNTRILIYCNNNFKQDAKSDLQGRGSKIGGLALNIPTFINLFGYGYKNIYELGPLIDVKNTKLQFEGTAAQ